METDTSVTDALCEKALDAFYGAEDWRHDYAKCEHWKPISSMRAALEAAMQDTDHG